MLPRTADVPLQDKKRKKQLNFYIYTWIRVSHVAEGATLAAQGGDQEACQVGQSPDKASLLREVSVEDTVVDDVILKPNALIDVLLIDKENWDLFQ